MFSLIKIGRMSFSHSEKVFYLKNVHHCPFSFYSLTHYHAVSSQIKCDFVILIYICGRVLKVYMKKTVIQNFEGFLASDCFNFWHTVFIFTSQSFSLLYIVKRICVTIFKSIALFCVCQTAQAYRINSSSDIFLGF